MPHFKQLAFADVTGITAYLSFLKTLRTFYSDVLSEVDQVAACPALHVPFQWPETHVLTQEEAPLPSADSWWSQVRATPLSNINAAGNLAIVLGSLVMLGAWGSYQSGESDSVLSRAYGNMTGVYDGPLQGFVDAFGGGVADSPLLALKLLMNGVLGLLSPLRILPLGLYPFAALVSRQVNQWFYGTSRTQFTPQTIHDVEPENHRQVMSYVTAVTLFGLGIGANINQLSEQGGRTLLVWQALLMTNVITSFVSNLVNTTQNVVDKAHHLAFTHALSDFMETQDKGLQDQATLLKDIPLGESEVRNLVNVVTKLSTASGCCRVGIPVAIKHFFHGFSVRKCELMLNLDTADGRKKRDAILSLSQTILFAHQTREVTALLADPDRLRVQEELVLILKQIRVAYTEALHVSQTYSRLRFQKKLDEQEAAKLKAIQSRYTTEQLQTFYDVSMRLDVMEYILTAENKAFDARGASMLLIELLAPIGLSASVLGDAALPMQLGIVSAIIIVQAVSFSTRENVNAGGLGTSQKELMALIARLNERPEAHVEPGDRLFAWMLTTRQMIYAALGGIFSGAATAFGINGASKLGELVINGIDYVFGTADLIGVFRKDPKDGYRAVGWLFWQLGIFKVADGMGFCVETIRRWCHIHQVDFDRSEARQVFLSNDLPQDVALLEIVSGFNNSYDNESEV